MFLYLAFFPLFFLWLDGASSLFPSSGLRIGLGNTRAVHFFGLNPNFFHQPVLTGFKIH